MQPQSFDTYAQSYDDHFTNSLIGKAQKTQSKYVCLCAIRGTRPPAANGTRVIQRQIRQHRIFRNRRAAA